MMRVRPWLLAFLAATGVASSSRADGVVVRQGGDGCPAKDPPPGRRAACPETPLTPEQARERVKGRADRDHDGIPDDVDRCPDRAETYNGFEDEDGCPDIADCVIKPGKIQIEDRLFFSRGSDAIDPRGFPILDTIAATLAAYPGSLEVKGHRAPKEKQGLSERRARHVADYLTTHGVDRARLTLVDYSATCPHVRAAQEPRVNRRVDFLFSY
jgi:outer membrane protein OmpA-like peptidoglycan-associated protein